MEAVRVGICGLGTVGSGVANLLKQNSEETLRKTGRDISLVHVGARRDHPDCDLSGIRVSRDIFAVANDPQVDIICELIGGTDVALELPAAFLLLRQFEKDLPVIVLVV